MISIQSLAHIIVTTSARGNYCCWININQFNWFSYDELQKCDCSLWKGNQKFFSSKLNAIEWHESTISEYLIDKEMINTLELFIHGIGFNGSLYIKLIKLKFWNHKFYYVFKNVNFLEKTSWRNIQIFP